MASLEIATSGGRAHQLAVRVVFISSSSGRVTARRRVGSVSGRNGRRAARWVARARGSWMAAAVMCEDRLELIFKLPSLREAERRGRWALGQGRASVCSGCPTEVSSVWRGSAESGAQGWRLESSTRATERLVELRGCGGPPPLGSSGPGLPAVNWPVRALQGARVCVPAAALHLLGGLQLIPPSAPAPSA